MKLTLEGVRRAGDLIRHYQELVEKSADIDRQAAMVHDKLVAELHAMGVNSGFVVGAERCQWCHGVGNHAVGFDCRAF